MNEYDVVVVGGSAAGLSAALVLSRARRRVLVVDSGVPRNAPAAHMQGFLSRDGMPPADLVAVGQREVRSYGGEVRQGDVTEVTVQSPTGFTVSLSDGVQVSARRVLVATGLRDELPDVPAWPSGGESTCCTARTATDTRWQTSHWASWAAPPSRCGTRTSSGNGRRTSSS